MAIPLVLPAELFASSGAAAPVSIDGIDPTGRFILGNESTVAGDSPTTMIRWDDGEPEVVSPPAGFQFAQAQAVNADGMVAGYAWQEANGSGRRAWTYRDGEFTMLATPDGHDVDGIFAVNAAGDVVGRLAPGYRALAVWWADSPDEPQLVRLPDGPAQVGVTIGDDGTIAVTRSGYLDPDVSEAHIWDADQGLRQLPPPAGVASARVSAVNGHWAVGAGRVSVAADSVEPAPGWAADPAAAEGTDLDVDVALRWDLRDGSGEIVGYADLSRYGLGSYGVAVTTAGEVLAVALAAGGDQLDGTARLTVLRDGLRHTLPVPPTGGGPGLLEVSGDGTILAGVVYTGDEIGSELPMMWQC